MQPGEARDRLTADVFKGCDDDAIAHLERAFDLTVETARLRRRLHEAHIDSIEEGVGKGLITESEGERLRAAEAAVSHVIAVDDFEPSQLSPLAEKQDQQRRIRQTASRAGAT